MKRIKLFFLNFTLITLFFISTYNQVNATNGACSYHGGVDCSMGAQAGGKVYCKDGWTESSTFYDFTSKCKTSDFLCSYGYCSIPYATGCTTESDYSTKKALIFKLGQSGTTYGQSQLAQCRNEINNHELELQKYKRCIAESEINYQKCINLEFQKLCLNFGYSKFNIDTNSCECFSDEYRDNRYQECLKIPNCSNNSFLNTEYKCQCNSGYVEINNACVQSVIEQATTETIKNQSTEEKITETSREEEIIITNKDELKKFIKNEKEKIKNIDTALSNRLKGKILLQTEQNGEGWYVNPNNQKRYFLGRPDDAFNIMRELGLGVSNKDFDSFKNVAPQKLSGKILLKVEDSGKAYYANPNDLKMYYLGRPDDAFNVMRTLGLGISNDNINKIDIN